MCGIVSEVSAARGSARPLPARALWLGAAIAMLSLSACRSTSELQSPAADGPSASAWQAFELPTKRPTRYVPGVVDGRPVIQADADSAVSLYRRRMRVAPVDLGRLTFSWMVPELISTADLSRPDAEDAPVRVVLGFDGDRSRLSYKNQILFDLMEAVTGEEPPYATLMYVWDNRAPLESIIIAGRTDRVRKIVVDTGPTQTSSWRLHERDIASDYRRAFGEAPGPLTSIALMTDSDNTRTKTRAYYGEVRLVGASGEPQ